MTWTILYNFDESFHDGADSTSSTGLSQDLLTLASEYAGLALKLCEKWSTTLNGESDDSSKHVVLDWTPMYGRSLTLVASCYAKAGSAVTAEGLYNSAWDTYKTTTSSSSSSSSSSTSNNTTAIADQYSPQYQKDAISCLLSHAKLLSQWEKRDVDAKLKQKEAAELREKMPSSWQGMYGIYGGLWFFSPNDFQL